MPLTAAEKMRRRREKLKAEGKYDDYKKKMREAVTKSREKKKHDMNKLPLSKQEIMQTKTREDCKARVAKYRLKLKQSLPTTPISSKAYINNKTMGKATAKANRALPKSPRKKKAVVTKLYEKFVESNDSAITEENSIITQDWFKSIRLNPDVVTRVQNFYERDDLTRQAPGRKDAISVKDANGVKTKIQIRHLTLSIKEMHEIFLQENPDCKIGKSKFFDLRPKHVQLSSKLPRNVCLCIYHENFKLAIEAFKGYHNFPSFSEIYNFLCDEKNESCWYGLCTKCTNQLQQALDNITGNDNQCHVMWHEWKKDSDGKLKKVVEEGTSLELSTHIQNLAPAFFKHVYVKREQSLYYRSQVEMALSASFRNLAIIQVDFAENYTCVYQDEVQSAHWKQNQISIFTASMWYMGEQHSAAIVSDNLTHSKETVIPFIDYILEKLPKNVKEVSIWSDGPSSQFKNRYVAAAIVVLEQYHKITLDWNYFATSHGKGPVDGIGGSIKRSVHMAVLKRKCIVSNAKEFVIAAQAQKSKVSIHEMSCDEIQQRGENLNISKLFAETPQIDGIKLFHHLKTQDGAVKGFLLSKDTQIKENDFDINIDDWYMVNYDNRLYPGIITAIEGDEYKVNVMVPVGSNWKWPNNPDEIFYSKDNLVQKIEPPIIFNSRGHFRLQN